MKPVILSCGCKLMVSLSQTADQKSQVKNAHELECSVYAEQRQKRRAAHAQPKSGTSRRSWERGDEERHMVDSYWGDGAYDNEFTTDAMVDEAFE